MADRKGEAPGTSTRGGVCSTMDSPWKNGASKGSQGTMNAPFNPPRAGGDNGLPTKIYDSMGGPSAGVKANSRDVPGTILTDPKGPRR